MEEEAPAPAAAVDESANSVSDAPTYNPATVKKRRMKYVRRLDSSATHQAGSLFYGAVKGRVRAPKRGQTKYDN